MAYISFDEQIELHVRFLQAEGLAVESLEATGKFIRCNAIGDTTSKRGSYCYKTWINPMDNDCVGLRTWVRGLAGKENDHSSYGLGSTGSSSPSFAVSAESKQLVKEDEARDNKILDEKTYAYFNIHSSDTGSSQYLIDKNIKPYGIRFRVSEQYGNTIVIPARDVTGKIRSCQNINEVGSKNWLKDRSPIGLFHSLDPLDKHTVILIAEGYATSATIKESMEGLDVATVCAFDASNMLEVGISVRSKYPGSKILFCGDNDRHLSVNKGLEASKEVSDATGAMSSYVVPDFVDLPPLKSFSDWNDLAREKGLEEVRRQISKRLLEKGFLE